LEKTISIEDILSTLSSRTINPLMAILEGGFGDASQATVPFPPIFIIGPPRSGSTLLYQALTDYFDIGYLSNFHAFFWGAPSWAERLAHPLRWQKPSTYRSVHGKTNGLAAPSECGKFWYRFFRRKPQYVPMDEADPRKMQKLRSVIAALTTAFEKPVLFKNLNCALRLAPLSKILPEALYIITKRDLLQNAHSLLAGRKKVWGEYNKWWSMEPPNIASLKGLPAYQQVVEQIVQINELIQRDMGLVGQKRCIEVKYENLCEDVPGTLNRLDLFFRAHNVCLNKKFQVPSKFSLKNERRIDSDLYQQLKEYVNEKQ